MKKTYGYLRQDFLDAATELSLLLTDVPNKATAAWLHGGKEHQDFDLNQALQDEPSTTPAELRAHYESSYVSIIISLHNMKDKRTGHYLHNRTHVERPDLICLGLLLKAQDRDARKPRWWYYPISSLVGKPRLNTWIICGFERGVWDGSIVADVPRARAEDILNGSVRPVDGVAHHVVVAPDTDRQAAVPVEGLVDARSGDVLMHDLPRRLEGVRNEEEAGHNPWSNALARVE